MDSRVKTSTGGFMASRKTTVTQWVLGNVDPYRQDLLDFGAGTGCYQSRILFDAGYNVTQLDLPECMTKWQEKDDLDWVRSPLRGMRFDVVMMSNVLNVQETMEDLERTVREALTWVRGGGVLVANYPASPRKQGWSFLDTIRFLMDNMGLFVCTPGNGIILIKE